MAAAGEEISTRPFQLVTGREWKGSAFGGARGRTDVPKIVDWYMEGKINIDDLITHTLPLERINEGFDLMKAGESIRSVVLYRERTAMLELVSSACHGGERFYRHDSAAIGLPMKFSVPAAAGRARRVPALFYLAATCTDETFAIKAGAQQYAAQHGLALVMPDTAARACAGETDAWDFGVGAGFYIDATEAPWSPWIVVRDGRAARASRSCRSMARGWGSSATRWAGTVR